MRSMRTLRAPVEWVAREDPRVKGEDVLDVEIMVVATEHGGESAGIASPPAHVACQPEQATGPRSSARGPGCPRSAAAPRGGGMLPTQETGWNPSPVSPVAEEPARSPRPIQ